MNHFKTRLWDLLGSMRLAISLLSVLAIASAIGTLVKQNEPMIAYIDQFGIFWAQWFAALGLYDVYNQSWFWVILLFLLTSTSVCLVRNTPVMLRDMRSFKNHTRTNSLRHLPEHVEWRSTQTLNEITQHAADVFAAQGYTLRAKQNEAGTYLAAKRGKYNRLGYILTHLAIVVICIGGLMDSELSMRTQVALLGKQPQPNSTDYKAVPPAGVLASDTLSYRGNVLLPEGAATDKVELVYDQGRYLRQELPFNIRLNQFVVEYYSTGVPKRFASNVTVHDKTTGETFEQTIEVNHPLRYKGVAVYQASFADGGSDMDLNIYPLTGTAAHAQNMQANMLRSQKIDDYTLEWREFKPITIEPMDDGSKQFKDFGPTLQFVLRDNQGDALEFRNYMKPIVLNDFPVLVSGVRGDKNQDFTYFGIPADGEQSPHDFMRLRAALADAHLRTQAVAAYIKNQSNTAPFTPEQLRNSAQKTIGLFAQGGNALETWLAATPEEQRAVVVKFAIAQLDGSLWQLLNIARAKDNLPALPLNEHNAQFMRIATERLSQSHDYISPVYVQLTDFKHLPASVLQMTRSPGQFWVYLGSLMLVLGTLAMTFIRERRVWLHIIPDGAAHQAVLAMSSTRRTMDYQQAWTALSSAMMKD